MCMSLPLLENDSASSSPTRTLSICLINPRFNPSYWGFEYALPLYPGDKRSTMISGSLSAVLGLCGKHDVYPLDENVEDIDWESLRKYDIVVVTGMTVQKERIRQILVKLREVKKFTLWAAPLSRSRNPSSTAFATSSSSAKPRPLGPNSLRILPATSPSKIVMSNRSRLTCLRYLARDTTTSRSIAIQTGPSNSRVDARVNASSVTSS